MSVRHLLCARSDVPPDGIIRIDEVPGIAGPVAVADSDGLLFCVADTCSHQTASLSDGYVEDGCVECPLHESRFDLRTGRPDVPPARSSIATYPVEVVDDKIYLVLDTP